MNQFDSSPPKMPMRWVWLVLALLLSICIAFEGFEYRRFRGNLRSDAQTAADEYGATVGRRLFSQFTELEFIGVSLLAPRPDGQVHPSPKAVKALSRFMALHPNLYAFNVQSSDGNRIIWSTKKQSSRPITRGAAFTPLPQHPQYLLGRARYASRAGGYAITMRFRARGKDGTTRYFVGTPFRLKQLLAYPDVFRAPWTLETVDSRTNTALADWRQGRPMFHRSGVPARRSRPRQTRLVDVPVRGLPLRIRASLPSAYISRVWVRSAWTRWIIEASLIVAVMALVRFLERSGQQRLLDAAAIERARMQDAQTGLLSRAAFEQRIVALAETVSPRRQLAVIVIDIEHFGRFNAEHGTAAGDRVLLALVERLQALSGATLLARVGADSFAFAHADILEAQVYGPIKAALASVEAPFPLSATAWETLSLSLGCALYPADTDAPSTLLGQAEAALFGQVQRESYHVMNALDPYGTVAAGLLNWAHPFLRHHKAALSEDLLQQLMADGRTGDVVRALADDKTAGFRKILPCLIDVLLDPDLTREAHVEDALHRGRLQIAVGVEIKAVTTAINALYQRISTVSQQIPGRLTRRQLFLRTVLRRIEIDLEIQHDAEARFRHEIHRLLSDFAVRIRMVRRSIDISDEIIRAIDRWPYVAFGAIFAQNVDGTLLIQAESEAHRVFFDQPEMQRIDGVDLEEIRTHPIVAALRSGELVHGRQDPEEGAGEDWILKLRREGIHSVVALPVIGVAGHVLAVIKLYGTLPNQFRASAVQDSLEALRLIASRGFEQDRSEVTALIPASERQIWRSQLFAGGLTMFMQPIFDFRAGRTTKVEALARLRLDDGQVISPGQFLPILNEHELDRLFVEGLRSAIRTVIDYQDHGLRLDLSVNLPPTTLRHHDCVSWIRSVLATHDFEPSRLTLELLEDREIGESEAGMSAAKALH